LKKKRDILVKERKRKGGSFWGWKKENERENIEKREKKKAH